MDGIGIVRTRVSCGSDKAAIDLKKVIRSTMTMSRILVQVMFLSLSSISLEVDTVAPNVFAYSNTHPQHCSDCT